MAASVSVDGELRLARWNYNLPRSRFGDWLAAANVVVDGPPDIRRLRKSTKVEKALAFGGRIADAANDHHEEVFRGHYAQGTTLRVMSGQVITTAQDHWFAKAVDGPTVLTDSTDVLDTPEQASIGPEHLPIWATERQTLLTLIDTPSLPASRKALLQRELDDVVTVLQQSHQGATVTDGRGVADQPQPSQTVSDRTAKRLRDAMDRLLAGRPQRTDGRLIKDNLWKEADVSRATMNHATQIMAEWDARVAACDGFTPREARKNDELTTLRDDLAAKTRECTKLSHQLDAAATVIAALHHDNTLPRQELRPRSPKSSRSSAAANQHKKRLWQGGARPRPPIGFPRSLRVRRHHTRGFCASSAAVVLVNSDMKVNIDFENAAAVGNHFDVLESWR